ncbi:MAG: PAS domain-containing protein, partial [Lysobacteraceae bacterium]
GRWLDSLLDTSILTPHGFCLAWDPALLWVHAGADVLTALAYFTISYVLLRLVRYRRDLAYPWVFRIFAAFILACGVTHAIGVLLLWEPYYWLAGIMKAATAALSVTTAILLRPLWPRILELPSPSQLRRVNAQLAAEIAARDAVANKLRASEARFRAIFECSPDALGLLRQRPDGEFRFEAINPALADLLGKPAEQIEHAALGTVFGQAQGDAAQRRYQDRATRGGTARFETEQQLHGRRHVLETALVSLTLFALMPRDMATAAIDTPGCRHAGTASALNSSLCRRRRRRPSVSCGGMVFANPPRVLMDTRLL